MWGPRWGVAAIFHSVQGWLLVPLEPERRKSRLSRVKERMWQHFVFWFSQRGNGSPCPVPRAFGSRSAPWEHCCEAYGLSVGASLMESLPSLSVLVELLGAIQVDGCKSFKSIPSHSNWKVVSTSFGLLWCFQIIMNYTCHLLLFLSTLLHSKSLWLLQRSCLEIVGNTHCITKQV